MVEARKEKRKGRAKGGMLLGKRRGWGNVGEKDWWKGEEGLMLVGIQEAGEKWIIMSVYNSWEWKELERKITRWLDELEDWEDRIVIIGGDWNVRTGELGNIKEAGIVRKSRDKTVGNGGRNFVEWVQNRGWYILNGTSKGDWEGEFTYVGARGSSVIDYIIVNEKAYDKVLEFKIEDRVDSDHMPLRLKMRKKEEEDRREEKGEEDEEKKAKYIEKIMWDEEAIDKFRERTEKLTPTWEEEPRSMEEYWQWMKKVALGAMEKRKFKIRRRKVGYKDWWDRECSRKKRGVRREYNLWRKGKSNLKKFIEVKKKYRELLVEKQRERREKEEKELKNIKKEAEAWNYINRKRGKKRFIGNNIKKEEWKNHFRNLLGGDERKDEVGRNQNEWSNQENEELQEKEIWEVIRKMKRNKAAGVDGLPMEVWKYAGKDLWSSLVKLMRWIWREEQIPEDWKKSIIVPIYKRGDPNRTGNYRGISLMCTAYKVYTELIRRRLEVQIEGRNCLPETQAGFRKGKSTMDNIFILTHLVQKEKSEEKENRLYAFFADLCAAFDNVDREILWRELKERNIEEGLIRKIEKIYECTEVLVKTEEGCTESFRTRKGVRQGCVLSPILFNMYMAGLSEELRNRKIGGVEVGNMRIWELAYADDVVLLARNKVALEDMMRTTAKFLKERKLELNAEKSKIMVFNRKKRERKEVWKWKGKEIEEVQVFKYLGFTLNREGSYREHLKDLVRKGRMAARKVWGLGEKMCRNDFMRRWDLFKYLVQSVISYGVEIWGWEEREELEKIMLDYVRWLFRIDFCTPRYIIYKELGMEKLRIGWSIRALRFEERCRTRGGGLIRECWKEKEERGDKDLYGRERGRFYERYREMERMREGERRAEDRDGREREIIVWERERDRKERYKRILKAKYNYRYKELITESERPRYLGREILGRTEMAERVRAMVKLRCGNLEEWNKYWLDEDKRLCKFCEKGKDSMEHFLGECVETREWFNRLGENREAIDKRIWSEDLDEEKGEALIKLWKRKERKKREAWAEGERGE